MKKFLKRI